MSIDALRHDWPVLTVLVILLIVAVTTIISFFLPGDPLMLPAPPLDNRDSVPAPPLDRKDSFERYLGIAVQRSMGSFLWWSRTNMVLQFSLILSSLAAAVIAASTTSDNVSILKQYSVILTALIALLAAAQQTFHVRENINSFIRSTMKLELLVYDYVFERAKLSKDGNSDVAGLLKLHTDIMQKYVDIEAERMRAWASIGQQATQPGGGGSAGGERAR